MKELLAHTPIWVFGLLAVLIVLGVQQMFDRTVSVTAAFILPVAMVVWSFVGVGLSFGFAFITLAVWLVSLCLCAGFLYRLLPVRGVSFDAEKRKFHISGSKLPFVIIMALFFTKYAYGAMSAQNVAFIRDDAVVYAFCAMYGAYSAFFVARAMRFIRVRASKVNAELKQLVS